MVIQVLDARDPLGCRCPQLEEVVLQKEGNKKMLLLLNKIGKWTRDATMIFPYLIFCGLGSLNRKWTVCILHHLYCLIFIVVDLVPKENVEKWIQCLQKEFPVVAFKASTQIKFKTVVGGIFYT